MDGACDPKSTGTYKQTLQSDYHCSQDDYTGAPSFLCNRLRVQLQKIYSGGPDYKMFAITVVVCLNEATAKAATCAHPGNFPRLSCKQDLKLLENPGFSTFSCESHLKMLDFKDSAAKCV